MDDEVTRWKSNKTGRSYTIRRHYTCQTTYCVYLATCHLCQAQYIGQTIRTMQKRTIATEQRLKLLQMDWGNISTSMQQSQG